MIKIADSIFYLFIIVLIVVIGLFFWIFIYPNIPKTQSTYKKNPQIRGKPMIISGKKKGMYYVEGRKDISSNESRFLLNNNEWVSYRQGEILSLNDFQILSDEGNPIFIERDLLLRMMSNDVKAREMLKLQTELELSNDRASHYEEQYLLLEARINEEVDKRVQQRITSEQAKQQGQGGFIVRK